MSLNKELDLDRPLQDISHEAILNIVRTANVLSVEGAVLFRRFGLTVAQFNVLFALKFKKRPVTQSDLGKRLVLTRASITSVLDKLEQKGLVSRNHVPDNRRIHYVELTAAGQALIDQVEPLYRRRIHAATGKLSERDHRKLIEHLECVRTHARLDSASE